MMISSVLVPAIKKLVFWGLLPAGIACHQSAPAFESSLYPACSMPRQAVPARAPNQLPADYRARYFDLTNVTQTTGIYLPGIPRNVIILIFPPGTSQALRQSAIDAVCGEVIGGLFGDADGVEGMYYVQIEDDGTETPLVEAVRLLRELPHVAMASPDLFRTYLRVLSVP